jgi:hypothetical protein
MKLTVTEDRLVQVEGVYLPIVLLTDKGERFIISMRDGGFEFRYNGKPYRAVNGVLSEVNPDQPEQSSEAESLTTVNGLSGKYNPDNDYMKVAERLYHEQNNATSKMDIPSIAYEYAERWHKEFRNDNTWVGTFYDWCIEYKQPKNKDHSKDEAMVGSGN